MTTERVTVPLTELYDIASGLSKPREEFGFGRPFLTFKDVLDNCFVPSRLGALVNSTAKDLEACSVMRGDVFLTRTSETQDELGMSCVALRDCEGATFNGFTKRLRPRKGAPVVPEFAGYYFRGPGFRRSVTAMSSLSTRASLNNEMIGRLSIALPSVEEQTAIGAVLKSLDDKIELNRQMNATLEAMARALFQSWFVDFDAVRNRLEADISAGADMAFSRLFPTRFSKTELGHTPEGWTVRSLDSVAEFLNGLALQRFPPDDGPTLPVIKIAQLRKGSSLGADRCNTKVAPNYVVQDGDVLFLNRPGFIGEPIMREDGSDAPTQQVFSRAA